MVSRSLSERMAWKCVTVDIDIEGGGRWETEYRLVKALYMLSYIPRRIVTTRHGIHVYFENIEVTELRDLLKVRALFGDDERRIEFDERLRERCLHLNVLFQTSELGEVEVDRVWQIVALRKR